MDTKFKLLMLRGAANITLDLGGFAAFLAMLTAILGAHWVAVVTVMITGILIVLHAVLENRYLHALEQYHAHV